MNRIVFYVLALAAVLMSASCAKDEDPAKPIDYLVPEKQATIHGTLLVNIDTTQVPQKYSAPEEKVTIIANISYADLSSDGGQKGAYSVPATTDEKTGAFILTVPATEDTVSVSIVANDIRGTQTQKDQNGSTVSVSGIWSWTFNGLPLKIISGQVVILPAIEGQFTPDKKAGGLIPID
jgi:hypothetical protein